jgi:hypothetical protein
LCRCSAAIAAAGSFDIPAGKKVEHATFLSDAWYNNKVLVSEEWERWLSPESSAADKTAVHAVMNRSIFSRQAPQKPPRPLLFRT